MTSSLPAGFKNLPVSRTLTLITLLTPLIASLSNLKYLFYYAYDPFILEYGQFWRLGTFQLSFLNESEVLVGLVLLYQLRSLERLYSSHKYLSIILMIYLYVVLFTSIMIMIDFYSGIKVVNSMSSGPTAIIFALLFQYREYIPVMYKFEVYGSSNNKVVLTDHAFIYLISFQLAISQGISSIGSSFLGWIIGALITRGLIFGKNWRIPFWKYIVEVKKAREVTPPIAGNDNTDEDATETRPLTTQFLDTFRR